MSKLSDKVVLDSVQTDIDTLISTAGTPGVSLSDSIDNVSSQITVLQDDKIGPPVGTNLSIDLQNAALAIQSQKYTYPDMANGVVVTGGAGAWGMGVYSELIATNAVADRFAVYALVVEAVTGVHQVTLGSGLAAAEVAFSQVTITTTGKYIIQGPAVAANLRIAAKTASKAGGAQTITCYLEIYKGIQP